MRTDEQVGRAIVENGGAEWIPRGEPNQRSKEAMIRAETLRAGDRVYLGAAVRADDYGNLIDIAGNVNVLLRYQNGGEGRCVAAPATILSAADFDEAIEAKRLIDNLRAANRAHDEGKVALAKAVAAAERAGRIAAGTWTESPANLPPPVAEEPKPPQVSADYVKAIRVLCRNNQFSRHVADMAIGAAQMVLASGKSVTEETTEK